jgi:hypothetical protein
MYRNAAGQMRRVPSHAWCYFGRNGLVNAWIHVQYEDLCQPPGTYRPVDTRGRLEYVMEALGWYKGGLSHLGFCPRLPQKEAARSSTVWGDGDGEINGW